MGTAIPLVALGLSAVGTVMQFQGSRQQARAATEQGEKDQQILEHNAGVKRQEAEAERDAAKQEAERFVEQGRRFRATQRVAFARAGVLSSEGTPAFVLEQTAQNLEFDRLAILEEGELRGRFRESEAAGLQLQGQAARVSSKTRARAFKTAGIGTLLTGIGSASLTASRFSKTPTTG